MIVKNGENLPGRKNHLDFMAPIGGECISALIQPSESCKEEGIGDFRTACFFEFVDGPNLE